MEQAGDDSGRMTPRRMIAERLRLLREHSDLTLRGLAEALGYPHPYISRVETGKQLPSEQMAQAFDTYFRTQGLFAGLLEMAHDAIVPDYSRGFMSREPEADRIQVFTSSLVPGLLQTEEYAYTLFSSSMLDAPEEKLREHVALRIRRQAILTRADPPRYWVIMDEAALMRPIGSAACMGDQLQHVLRMSKEKHVTVQVIPFAEGAYPMLGGFMNLLTLPNGSTIAFVESFTAGTVVESPKKVLGLIERFDVARSLALSEEKSAEMIRGYAEKYGHDDTAKRLDSLPVAEVDPQQ